MHRPLLALVALPLAALSLAAFPAAAQTPARRDTLPPLAPRDVEIRGELRVSLPSIERQPITGFARPARPRRIDPARRPWTETYAQRDLPASPLGRPVPPEIASLDAGVPRRGAFEIGAGRYLARFGRIYLATPPTGATGFYGAVDYDGSDALIDGARADYDAGRARLGLRTGNERVGVDVQADAFGREHRLYAFDPSALRDGTGGGVTASIDGTPRDGLAFGVEARVRATRFGGEGDGAGESAENRAGLAVRLAQDGAAGRPGFYAQAAGDVASTNGRDASFVDAGAGVALGRGRLTLTAGPRVLLTTGSDGETLVSADVDVRFRPSDGVELFAANRPRVERNDVEALFDTNPYLVGRPDARAFAVPVRAEAGVKGTRGPAEGRVWAAYDRAPSMRYFEEAGAARGGLTDVAYGRIAETRAGADVRVLVLRGLHASAGGELRSPRFLDASAEDDAIPYRAEAAGFASVGYRLPRGRGFVQATLEADGVRYADRAAALRLDPVVDLDLYGSFALTSSLTLIARADNLISGANERWLGYREPGAVAMLGLSVRW